jgi:ABC-type antimicrobial peptide transport system permease subunit
MKIFLLFSIIFGLSITFLFCLIPVHKISRQSVQVAFMGLSKKVSKQRGRKMMLFVQMLIMLLFLSVTVVIRLQVNRVKDNIWHTLSIEEQKNIFGFSFSKEIMSEGVFDVIIQQLKQSSDIDDVFISDFSFFGARNGYSHNTTIGQHENQPAREYKVSNNFADFFNTKIIMGRFWNENDAPDVAVVDETLAALFPDNNPLGMNIDGKTIIGIVENVQMIMENQRYAKKPVFYSPVNKAENGLGIYVKAIAGKRENVQQHIIQIQKEFYPEFSQSYFDFQTEISYVLSEEDAFSRLFGIFSVISIILCLLSIYSAINMNTEKRRKEVAIRKINGAAVKDIILLFSKSYILIWSVVCALIFPVIYFAGNLWLETFNQRISLNVFFFSGIYFSVLALILLIIIFRILEVARCNPADVLKSE